jgi:DNA sulfur modification protein DndD
LKEEQAEIEACIEETEKRLRTLCEGLFPMSLCPAVGRTLKKQLFEERKAKRQAVMEKELAKILKDIKKLTAEYQDPRRKIPREYVAAIEKVIERRMKLKKQSIETVEIVHGLSEADSVGIIGLLEAAQKQSLPEVLQHSGDLESLERKLQEVQRKLMKAPAEATLRPLFQDLTQKNKMLGQYQHEKHQLDGEITKLDNRIAAKRRELEKVEGEHAGAKSLQRRLEIVSKMKTALDIYLDRLTRMKIEVLRKTVAECFNRLSRKGDLIERIDIDPATFSVNLYNKSSRRIPKEELSSGEKQIYAIAMLWALARTAGRPLPVIIDTPLGRLDSDHRRNLIHHYFPFASHQVILLSTDTEIDLELFKELGTYVSHCYHLVYDKTEQRALSREEYFWKAVGHA